MLNRRLINRCHFGDCAKSMENLITGGVKIQTCITSPPYWGLRDYQADGQIGLEKKPEDYIDTMVDAFALVRELMNDDGTLWLNMGDCYWGSWGNKGARSGSQRPVNTERYGRKAWDHHTARPGSSFKHETLKPKDLVGMPWRLAFALQADGWYLRTDIIWHKKNPMPESVKDRPVRAHEFLFLLSKSARYYYNADAIKEPGSENTHARKGKNNGNGITPKAMIATDNVKQNPSFEEAISDQVLAYRQKRTVWEIATQPYGGAHFAVFPEALVEPCVLAGSRPEDIVLDPFLGSGTTAAVAERLGRQWVGCELNQEYQALQDQRLQQQHLTL